MVFTTFPVWSFTFASMVGFKVFKVFKDFKVFNDFKDSSDCSLLLQTSMSMKISALASLMLS